MTASAKAAPTTSTDDSETGRRDSIWLYILLALLGTAGFFYVNLGAAYGDTLTNALGFTSEHAGYVISANIYGSSLGGLIAVFLIRRFAWRPMLIGLLVGVLALEVASMWIQSYGVLLPIRSIDGLVGGTSVGIALSLLARTQHPDRAFGMLLMFQFAFGGLGSWALPHLVAEYGAWVLFATMAAIDLAAVLTAIFLRLGDAHHGATKAASKSTRGVPVRTLTVAALVALFLFQAAQMGLFAFIIPLGKDAGQTLSFITQTVGATTWIGALGALFVIVVGAKWGRVGPLSIALVLAALGIAALTQAQHPSMFFAGNVLSAITWSAAVPYLFGIVSRLDRSGRMATLAGFISGAGLASGPLIAGLLAQPDNYVPMITAAVAFLVVAVIGAAPTAMRVDRLDKKPSPEVS